MLSGSLKDDVYLFSLFGVFAGYFLYFNYPIIQWSIRHWLRSLRNLSGSEKSPQEEQKKYLDETKLADKYLDTSTSADFIYEFLGPTRFVSDHLIYRILTPVYAAAFTLLVILLYYYVPPGLEKPGNTLQDLLSVSIWVSGFIAYTSIARFSALKWRDYPYYLAKAYFALGETQTELSLRLRYFVDGMEAYNLFLQRNLKLKIRELQSIYSLLSSDEVTVQQNIIRKLWLAFHNKEQKLDKLEPFRGIKNMMQENYKKEIVTGVSKRRTLEEWIPLIALVISSVIAVLQIFVK
jgi:hypothetical protein